VPQYSGKRLSDLRWLWSHRRRECAQTDSTLRQSTERITETIQTCSGRSHGPEQYSGIISAEGAVPLDHLCLLHQGNVSSVSSSAAGCWSAPRRHHNEADTSRHRPCGLAPCCLASSPRDSNRCENHNVRRSNQHPTGP